MEIKSIKIFGLPELPESPYLMRKDDKKAQRIRHSK